MGLLSMFLDSSSMCSLCSFPCSTPIRDRISVAPPMLFSGYTSSRPLSRHVFGEQRGGAAEILSWIGVLMAEIIVGDMP